MKKATEAAPALGRPPLEFSEHFADLLLEAVATTPQSLARIVERLQAKHAGFPAVSSIYKLLRSDESFSSEYSRAKQDQADLLADEMVDIADDDSGDADGSTSVQRAKLKIWARQWVCAKMKPKQYGDKISVDSKVNHEHSVSALFSQIVQQPSLLGCVPTDAVLVEAVCLNKQP